MILAAEEAMNDERSEALICGAVKHLRSNRSKPDQIVSLTLMYLAKSKPALFCTEIIIEVRRCTFLLNLFHLYFEFSLKVKEYFH